MNLTRLPHCLAIALGLHLIALVNPTLGQVAALGYGLAAETNGAAVILTWTNDPAVHLMESTNASLESAWQLSTRAPEYFGGWRQVTISNFFEAGLKFYRLRGRDGVSPALEIRSRANDIHVRWRSEHAGFRLQQSMTDQPPYEWDFEGSDPAPAEGYKRLTVNVPSNAPLFFRVTHPLNHVLVVGQSLAIGGEGLPLLSTDQPYANQMFSRKAPYEDDLTALVPLVEQAWPDNRVGETIASGFANWIGWMKGVGSHDLLVSNSGRGGQPYANLKRGTEAYAQATNQVAAAYRLRSSLGYRPRAVFAVHGEADAPNVTYDSDVAEWQRNLEADIQSITGSGEPVPMFHSQMSYTRGFSQFGLLAAHEQSPRTTVLVGPKYFLPYSDGIHLSNHGYRWLGEYYAKAYHQHVMEGRPWSPVRPISIERSNNVVMLTFTGVVDRLVLDTNLVRDPRESVSFPLRQEGPLYFSLIGNPGTDRVTVPEHSLVSGEELLIFAEPPPGGASASYQWFFVHSVIDSRTIRLTTNATASPLIYSNAWNVVGFTPVRSTVGSYGFEYYDDSGAGLPWACSTRVTGVALENTNRVRITLNQAPQGQNRRLRYAYTVKSSIHGPQGGPQTGPRGCLRDNDPTPSQYGYTLYNWCVHFDKPIP